MPEEPTKLQPKRRPRATIIAIGDVIKGQKTLELEAAAEAAAAEEEETEDSSEEE